MINVLLVDLVDDRKSVAAVHAVVVSRGRFVGMGGGGTVVCCGGEDRKSKHIHKLTGSTICAIERTTILYSIRSIAYSAISIPFHIICGDGEPLTTAHVLRKCRCCVVFYEDDRETNDRRYGCCWFSGLELASPVRQSGHSGSGKFKVDC